MGMFDSLRVEGADRERFRAPWGTVYDDFQSKGLCDLIDAIEPSLAEYLLLDGALYYRLRYPESSRHDDWQSVRGSGEAVVYAFADEPSSRGWVEWCIVVEHGRVVDVRIEVARQPDG